MIAKKGLALIALILLMLNAFACGKNVTKDDKSPGEKLADAINDQNQNKTPKIKEKYEHHTRAITDYQLEDNILRIPQGVQLEETYGNGRPCPGMVDPLESYFSLDEKDLLHLSATLPPEADSEVALVRVGGEAFSGLIGAWSHPEFIFKDAAGKEARELIYVLEFTEDGQVIGHSFCTTVIFE